MSKLTDALGKYATLIKELFICCTKKINKTINSLIVYFHNITNSKNKNSHTAISKKFAIIILSVLLIAVMLSLVTFLVVIPQKELSDKYDSALIFMNSANYDEAIAMFSELNGYKDSSENINYCLYSKANELMSRSEYDSAKIIFIQLAEINYRDSLDMINLCSYSQAVDLFNAGNYTDAKNLFEQLYAIAYMDSGFFLQEIAMRTTLKSIDSIKTELGIHPDFYSQQSVDIINIEVIKRQTNFDDKEDIIYVQVLASNEIIKCELSYQLIYNYYNEGWILDSVSPYEEDSWHITPLVAYVPEYEYYDKEINLASGVCIFYFRNISEYTYLEEITKTKVYFCFNQNTLEWLQSDSEVIGKEYNWSSSLIGTWVSTDGPSEIKCLEFRINKVNGKSISVTIYDTERNKNVYEGTVTMENKKRSFSSAYYRYDEQHYFEVTAKIYYGSSYTADKTFYIGSKGGIFYYNGPGAIREFTRQ